MRESKSAPYQATAAKQLFDFFRGRIGGDVEVFGYLPQEEVADASPDEVGFEAGVSQRIEYLESRVADVSPRDRMIGASNDCRFSNDCYFLLSPRSLST